MGKIMKFIIFFAIFLPINSIFIDNTNSTIFVNYGSVVKFEGLRCLNENNGYYVDELCEINLCKIPFLFTVNINITFYNKASDCILEFVKNILIENRTNRCENYFTDNKCSSNMCDIEINTGNNLSIYYNNGNCTLKERLISRIYNNEKIEQQYICSKAYSLQFNFITLLLIIIIKLN